MKRFDELIGRTVRVSACIAFSLSFLSSHFLLAQTEKAKRPAYVIAVSPAGDDNNPGTREKPFLTLQRAQAAVRTVNTANDVEVELASGTYRLGEPLIFTALDGGRDGHTVVWKAAGKLKPEHAPVLSGAIPVTGFKPHDKVRNIYVADTPKGLDARQLWVNNKLVQRGKVEARHADFTFDTAGMQWKDPKHDYLAKLPNPERIEIESTGYFTDRFSPVARIEGRKLLMQQPAWENNIWGYDTVNNPFRADLAHLYFVNSLAFVSKPGDWYLDPVAGKLYLIPPVGADAATMDVELPRLAVLVAVGNSLDAPVEDLSFQGLRFSYTTWLGASTREGYASQQSGTYLRGHALAYPADPITDCNWGCPAYESMRNEWSQMPAAVQVAAVARVSFDRDIFAHLGQYALGIGNDANANLTGVGLGASDVQVTRSVFTDNAGGAIVVGGVQRDAHHPHDPRQINRQILLVNNRIQSVSKEYRDHTAILSTYVIGAVILHNDISDVPYNAIDTGFGWGTHDPNGNPNYRVRLHGYEWKQNLVYTTPTTHRDVVVASNRIHNAKRLFGDGGTIYNQSASPSMLITENYIYDNNGQICLYLDEGSRYIAVRRNVIACKECEWLNINTMHAAMPMRISPDNVAVANWHDGTVIGGMWTNYQNDLILDDHFVEKDAWPEEAKQVMKNSGIEPSAGLVGYLDAQPSAEEMAAIRAEENGKK